MIRKSQKYVKDRLRPADQPLTVERVKHKFNWRLDRSFSIEQILAFANCPFCALSFTGYATKPLKHSCSACFGLGRIPAEMAEELCKTVEFAQCKLDAETGDPRD